MADFNILDPSTYMGGITDLLSSQGLSGAINLGTAAYDIYSGIQAQNQADRMYDIVYGTAAQQDAWAQELSNRTKSLYWPLEEKNFQYATEDINALRPSSVAARDYNIQRSAEQLAQARQLDPLFDANRSSLVNTLTTGTPELQQRLMNEASANVSQAFDQSRTAGMRQFGQAGINPSSGALADYNRTMDQQQALAQATARTQAARSGEDIGLSRQSQALNLQAGIPLPTYQTTPSVSAGNISSAQSGSGTLAGQAAAGLSTNAQNAFTGAATSLNSLYYNPIQKNLTDSFIAKMNRS